MEKNLKKRSVVTLSPEEVLENDRERFLLYTKVWLFDLHRFYAHVYVYI